MNFYAYVVIVFYIKTVPKWNSTLHHGYSGGPVVLPPAERIYIDGQAYNMDT